MYKKLKEYEYYDYVMSLFPKFDSEKSLKESAKYP